MGQSAIGHIQGVIPAPETRRLFSLLGASLLRVPVRGCRRAARAAAGMTVNRDRCSMATNMPSRDNVASVTRARAVVKRQSRSNYL